MPSAAPEPVAHTLQLLLGEPGAPVGDDDRRTGAVDARRDPDLLALGRELQRVVDDGVERAGERDRVGPSGDRGGSVEREADALLLGEGTPGRDAFTGEGADVREPEVGLRVLGQREVQQIVQDVRQALALRPHRRDLLVALGEFERQELDPQQQGGQRVAQLVGGVGDEGTLLLQHVLDVVGHLVERLGQTPEFRWAFGHDDPGAHPAAGDVMGGRVQRADRQQHPAGEPEGGAEGDKHGCGLAQGDEEPAAHGPGAHLAGGRVGHHHGDDVTVPDHR